jgi:hypothetical protein
MEAVINFFLWRQDLSLFNPIVQFLLREFGAFSVSVSGKCLNIKYSLLKLMDIILYLNLTACGLKDPFFLNENKLGMPLAKYFFFK